MNKRSVKYMRTHDMDMCFSANGIMVHCATNGTLLPNALRDIPTFNTVKLLLRNNRPLYGRDELFLNEEHLEEIIRMQRAIMNQYNRADSLIENSFAIEIADEFIRENYLMSFVDMAMRGAHSYDHQSTQRISNKIVKESYVLVAKPNVDIKPVTILRKHTNVDFRIPDITDIVEITHNTLTVTVDYSEL